MAHMTLLKEGPVCLLRNVFWMFTRWKYFMNVFINLLHVYLSLCIYLTISMRWMDNIHFLNFFFHISIFFLASPFFLCLYVLWNNINTNHVLFIKENLIFLILIANIMFWTILCLLNISCFLPMWPLFACFVVLLLIRKRPPFLLLTHKHCVKTPPTGFFLSCIY